jgi:hypothetical protein
MSVDESRREAWRAMQRDRARHDNEPDDPALKGGGGGGTSDDMALLKDYVDARDEAVETRLNSKLDTLATHKDVRNNVWGAVAAALALGIGLIAFGGDRFDAGVGMADYRQAQLQRDASQDRQMIAVDRKLDLILAAQQTGKKPSSLSSAYDALPAVQGRDNNQAASEPTRR